MAQGITHAPVPHAWRVLQSGHTLTFAPFGINQQGIGYGREWLPWFQVQEITRKDARISAAKVGM
jgi:hypothetical protein